jgi:uroporphyrinogen-III synthase
MRVLLSRAMADGERTAERLAAGGHTAVLAPVTTIEPTGAPPPREPWDALVLTSAHAVTMVAGLGVQDTRVFAVGERTAAAARSAGFARVEGAAGDALSLARLVAATLASSATLLHATAPDRKAEPEASLSAAGFRVLVWECYAARPVHRLSQDAVEALRARHFDTALHFSRRSAALLVDLADREGLVPNLRTVPHLCLSADVAAPLAAMGFETLVAPEPNERGLTALLDRLVR